MENQIVYYFDGKATIGYCPECGVTAVFTYLRGFICPVDKNHEISIFEWNRTSAYPGGE